MASTDHAKTLPHPVLVLQWGHGHLSWEGGLDADLLCNEGGPYGDDGKESDWLAGP